MTCCGVSTLRLKRMNPQGRSDRMNRRSSALNSGPKTPVMKARVLIGPISPRATEGSRKPLSIPLDDALSAGAFQAAAELRCFLCRAKWPDHGAVIDALLAEIGALDRGRTRAEHARELALQHPVG